VFKGLLEGVEEDENTINTEFDMLPENLAILKARPIHPSISIHLTPVPHDDGNKEEDEEGPEFSLLDLIDVSSSTSSSSKESTIEEELREEFGGIIKKVRKKVEEGKECANQLVEISQQLTMTRDSMDFVLDQLGGFKGCAKSISYRNHEPV